MLGTPITMQSVEELLPFTHSSLARSLTALVGRSAWVTLKSGADSGDVDKGTFCKISNCRLCPDCIECAPTWDSKVREENTQDVLELNPALGLMRS